MKDAFKRADTNDNKTLDLNEIVNLMNELNMPMTVEQAQQVGLVGSRSYTIIFKKCLVIYFF